MDKEEIIKKICKDFDYTKEELNKWNWIEIEANQGMYHDIFFNGDYVLFAEDKVIWY